MGKIKNLLPLNSLRQRYLFLAAVLEVLVLAITWYTAQHVYERGHHNSRNIEQRIELAEYSHQLRKAVVSAANALDLFLLYPRRQTRERFFVHLNEGRRQLQHLRGHRESGAGLNLAMLRRMAPLLNQLEAAARQIMQVRQSAELMYPAMRLANGEMLESNNTLQTDLDIAIQTLEARNRAGGLEPYERPVLQRLYEIRHTWHGLIAAYRLYLINRLGSLYETELSRQSNDVASFFAEIEAHVAALEAAVNDRRLELEVELAIDTLKREPPRWYRGFEEVVRINTEGHWRGDLPLIEDVIQPLLGELYEDLDKVDDQLKQSADQDLVRQTVVTQSVSNAMWATGGVVLVLVALSFILLETQVIRPVSRVTKGLKDEACGRASADLPPMQTREMRDLSEAYRELRDQVSSRQSALEHIALHDALTSLPNRNLLMQRMNYAIEAAREQRRSLALLMLDLDRFKEINDTLGHQSGDSLLQQVGDRLRRLLRSSDTVARLGGDEFAVILPEVDERNAERIAVHIHEELEKVYEVAEHSLYVGVSLGIALFPQHGENAEALLQHADVAMYMAKRSNSGVSVYDVERDSHSLSQLSVLSDLRAAVEQGGFFVAYQPKFTMRDRRLVGVEALVRWQHPQRGVVPPDEFIPIAEQTGLIKRITCFVLETAVRDCAELNGRGHRLGVSVNLSVWDIQDVNLPTTIGALLEKWQLPAGLLELEVTESVMMAEPERARHVLGELDSMGVSVVIDDFGTGFSSLAYLKQLPVDKLKIDKSFVLDMVDDENDAAIVLSTIELGHNLGLEVVAEGVETAACWARLQALGCDYAQGYYVGQPLPREALEAILRSPRGAAL